MIELFPLPAERAQGGGFSVVNVSVLGTTYQLGQDLFDLFSLAQERGGVSTVYNIISTVY